MALNILKYNMFKNDDIEEIKEIAENQGVDIEDAERIKELMDEEGLDEDEAAEIAEAM